MDTAQGMPGWVQQPPTPEQATERFTNIFKLGTKDELGTDDVKTLEYLVSADFLSQTIFL